MWTSAMGSTGVSRSAATCPAVSSAAAGRAGSSTRPGREPPAEMWTSARQTTEAAPTPASTQSAVTSAAVQRVGTCRRENASPAIRVRWRTGAASRSVPCAVQLYTAAGQVCIRGEGGEAQCGCREGWRPRNGDPTACEDRDECEIPGVCGHGDCINTLGSFHCECHQGFELGGGGECEDRDECGEEAGRCGVGSCSNTPGSFECNCPPGWEFTGGTCADLDECRLGNPCVAGRCANRQGGKPNLTQANPSFPDLQGGRLLLPVLAGLLRGGRRLSGPGRVQGRRGGVRPGHLHQHSWWLQLQLSYRLAQ